MMPARSAAGPFRRALRAAALAAVLAAPAAGLALDYRLDEARLAPCAGACPRVIVASGEIEHDEDARFGAFLAAARAAGLVGRQVLLESHGGFLDGGIALGSAFRENRMAVTVARLQANPGGAKALLPAMCASACVLALAGGVDRQVVTGSRVGVHRASLGPTIRDAAGGGPIGEMRDHSELMEARARHYRAMGVDPALAALTDSTPNNAIRWLEAAEITRFRLATMR